VDLTDQDRVTAAFRSAAPDIVVHAAALSRVDQCYRSPQLAEATNARATEQLMELADARHARLLYVSTDMVFDGEKGAPYNERDSPAPLSQYGRSKQRGEMFVAGRERAVVARVSLLVGPRLHNGTSFFDEQCQALREGKPLRLFVDEWRTAIDYPTAARALWALALSDLCGILHIGGPQRLSRWEIGLQLADLLRADKTCVRPITHAEMPAAEPRPRDVSLDSSRWRRLFPDIPWRPWTESFQH
jgi:dTDP-4-dehydrorhamnose reductase